MSVKPGDLVRRWFIDERVCPGIPHLCIAVQKTNNRSIVTVLTPDCRLYTNEAAYFTDYLATRWDEGH